MHHLSGLSSRTFGRSVVLWLFGIFTSLLLVGLWGRSVTDDRVTLEQSTRAVLESELVNRRVTDWLSEAIGRLDDATMLPMSPLVDDVVSSPELDEAIVAVVDATVDAALAPPDRPSSLDLEPAVERLRPAIDRAITGAGLPVESSIVTDALDDVVLTSNDMVLAAGAVAGARSLLTRVVLIGLLGLVATGSIAVWTAEDRIAQLRSLSWRIALSAFTFGIMLRIGAWAVDPDGGRSPIAAGSAIVLASNGHIPAAMAAVFASISVVVSTMMVRRRGRAASDRPVNRDESPVLVGVE